MSRDYRLSPAMTARVLGLALVALAGLVLVATLVALVLQLPASVMVVTAVVGLVLLAGAAYWLRRVVVVHLDEAGYRVRLVRGVGTPSARWVDVREAVTAPVAGETCVVLRLRDGGSTTIPLSALEVEPDRFFRELREHLQRGHGLRSL